MENYENIYSRLCRVCLSQINDSAKMVSLIENTNENLTCYGKAIMSFCNISIPNNSYLPTLMCGNCLELLKEAIRFKLLYESSSYQLKKITSSVFPSNRFRHEFQERVVEYLLYKKYLVDNSTDKDIATSSNVTNILGEDDIMLVGFQSSPESSCAGLAPTPKRDFISMETSTRNSDWSYEDIELDQIEGLINDNRLTISSNNARNKQLKSRHSNKAIVKKPVIKANHNKTNCSSDIKKTKKIKPKIKLMRTIRKKNKDIHNIACKLCNKVLKNIQTFNNHMQRHKGCRYICEVCGKGFPIRAELNLHQVAVHGTGDYKKCSYCDFKYFRPFQLAEHVRIHTGERPFTCEKCSLTFRTRYTFHLHKIRHGEKSVKCLKCDLLFHSRNRMLEHFNSAHERLHMFSCHICGVTYAKNISMRTHLTEKHGIPRDKQGRLTRINIKKVNICTEDTISG